MRCRDEGAAEAASRRGQWDLGASPMSIPTHSRTSGRSKYLRARPSAAWRGSGLGYAGLLLSATETDNKYLLRARLSFQHALALRVRATWPGSDHSRFRGARAVALACCWLTSVGPVAAVALGAPATLAAPKASPSSLAPPDVVSWPEGARISLELRRVPLCELLSMLSAQSGVRFRLATIPDVEVSVSLRDAPLPQAVRDLLAFHGFDLRAGPDAFWLVDAPAAPVSEAPQAPARRRLAASSWGSSGRAASSPRSEGVNNRASEPWRWWTNTSPPPPRWMTQNSTETAYEGAPRKSGVPGVVPFGVRVRLQPPPLALARWKGGIHRFGTASPGVTSVPSGPAISLAPPPTFASATSAATSPIASAPGSSVRWCARWPLFLRLIPTRCLLVIESERPANFYINGARLLHLWTGRRTLEVSGSLQEGPNLLALEWPAPAIASSKSPASEPPVLRYEWFVAH